MSNFSSVNPNAYMAVWRARNKGELKILVGLRGNIDSSDLGCFGALYIYDQL